MTDRTLQPTMTPETFVAKWAHTPLSERSSYQIHFNDVCDLIGVEKPGGHGVDTHGRTLQFEFPVTRADNTHGFVDVFYRGHFAIEYKSPNKPYATLDEAYRQLTGYRDALGNPPLLVVCDTRTWRIYTNWTNTEQRVYRFTNADLTNDETRRIVRFLLTDPERLRPDKYTEAVTVEASFAFQTVVDQLRSDAQLAIGTVDPDRIARFVCRLLFCMFAEDIGLLPDKLLTAIIRSADLRPKPFTDDVRQLFAAMSDGGRFNMRDIYWFNGSLFTDAAVEPVGGKSLQALYPAAQRDWRFVAPSIFGTLFERVLDPRKRGQLGAHYTGQADIERIVEPVLMLPLRRLWRQTQAQALTARAAYDAAPTPRERAAPLAVLKALRETILQRVRTTTVLDPACGSGNFLYVALRLLLDLEHTVLRDPVWDGLFSLELPQVHPGQIYGIEVEPIAHALASIVVWIGYLQWLDEHSYGLPTNPVLKDLSANIRCIDAIMTRHEGAPPTEPDWPTTTVIIGNPPFLGGNQMRASLGSAYVDDLFRLYAGRLGATADLVTYWFEKARAQLEAGKVERVGFIATNSIRGGANRRVLERIKQSGDIFMAWADREWTIEGAAVRVSLVGFDDGKETERTLDGKPVKTINPDLSAFADLSSAKPLPENAALGFRGNQKGGAFDIDDAQAQAMLTAVNASGRSNADVLKRWYNGDDLVHTTRNMWLIDFGVSMPLEIAEQYQAPFAYIRSYVKPVRDTNNRRAYRERWWIHAESRPTMRASIARLPRYIVTPHVSKHRVFVWLTNEIIPDHQLIVIARDDDYTFGVLHSRFHELWSLRMGTSLEDRPRYTPTTTFETFPFPFAPRTVDFADPLVLAISTAAAALHAERANWLAAGEQHTLTLLYNALVETRGGAPMPRVRGAAALAADRARAFAPRLAALHDALDAAVCAAYGWSPAVLTDETELLTRLLALNTARATPPPGGASA